MSSIKIHLFGRFEVCVGDKTVECFRSQKALELFCYLMLFHNQPHHREQLAEVFWGQRPTSQSKKYLRKTIWQLQSSLKELPRPSKGEIIRIEPDWLQFNRDVGFWIDVLEFESIWLSLSGRQGREFDTHQYRAAKRAIQLYRSDLLEGCFHDWCIFERERLKDFYLGLVDKLMGYCEANESYEAGILYGRKLLALDPARESTHLRLMRLLYFSGDRTGALRQYDSCKSALRKEFHIEPGEKIINLHRHISNESLNNLISSLGQFQDQQLDQSPESTIKISLDKIRKLLVLQTSIPQNILEEIRIIEEELSIEI